MAGCNLLLRIYIAKRLRVFVQSRYRRGWTKENKFSANPRPPSRMSGEASAKTESAQARPRYNGTLHLIIKSSCSAGGSVSRAQPAGGGQAGGEKTI